MIDKPLPSANRPTPDHPETARPSAKPGSAANGRSATQVWGRQAGRFGRNPVPRD